MTESERKRRARDLFTKQAFEAAKLESDLRSNEINAFNDILNVSLFSQFVAI